MNEYGLSSTVMKPAQAVIYVLVSTAHRKLEPFSAVTCTQCSHYTILH